MPISLSGGACISSLSLSLCISSVHVLVLPRASLTLFKSYIFWTDTATSFGPFISYWNILPPFHIV
jgi:hypothetical protein